MSLEILQELRNLLKQKFNQNFLAIVLFGSIVKGNFTSTSDIDVLVVCETLIKDWRARDKMTLELTEDIELKYATPLHLNLVSKDEISHAIDSVSPLMLEIYEANEIIYDKENFFKKILADFKRNIHRWHAEKIEDGVWKIPDLTVI
ncbi:MAG: nucleotidyltransferase domain-containing protein [Candidatus Methanoperedenaceae archaeon]|nr:nucleotidyltransferase domain-containing protein [Candidatus Methanoperedenaceae archaeon]